MKIKAYFSEDYFNNLELLDDDSWYATFLYSDYKKHFERVPLPGDVILVFDEKDSAPQSSQPLVVNYTLTHNGFIGCHCSRTFKEQRKLRAIGALQNGVPK